MSVVLELASEKAGTWIAPSWLMKRQALGALIAMAFVAAFIASVAFHSVVAAISVLLSGVTVAFIVGIAWMRTAPPRVGTKLENQHSLP